MRRLALIVVVLSALAPAANALAQPLFVITGRGWGHSVGMSQWGAYGMVAKDPATTHEQILLHYYSGTQLETRSNVTVRVLLASGRSSLRVGSAQPFKANARKVAAGDYRVTPTADGRIRVWGVGYFASPIRFAPGTAPLELGSSRYRGKLDVRRSNGSLQARNVLSREVYLRGVVPGEVPSAWPAAVLRAQAVAARSWVTRSLRPKEWFDVYPDTRSQVYGGVGYERASTNKAVVDTAGQVLTYGGAVAQTFYHSSSGGRTAASVDVWGGDVPYLQSVPDFDLFPPENPHRLWQLNLTGAQLAARTGTRVPRDATLTRDASRLAQRLTLSGAGWTRAIEGSETLRSRLGVKSARFWVGVLALTPARSRVVFGGSVGLSGIARGVGKTYLEWRPYGHAQWRRAAEPLATTGGKWSAKVKPGITTSYRVVSPRATGIARRVSVAPRVNYFAPETRTELRGLVRPKRAGATVAIQRRQTDGTWKTLKTVETDASGEFSAAIRLRAGAYRGVARIGRGYVPGRTPILHVS